MGWAEELEKSMGVTVAATKMKQRFARKSRKKIGDFDFRFVKEIGEFCTQRHSSTHVGVSPAVEEEGEDAYCVRLRYGNAHTHTGGGKKTQNERKDKKEEE